MMESDSAPLVDLSTLTKALYLEKLTISNQPTDKKDILTLGIYTDKKISTGKINSTISRRYVGEINMKKNKTMKQLHYYEQKILYTKNDLVGLVLFDQKIAPELFDSNDKHSYQFYVTSYKQFTANSTKYLGKVLIAGAYRPLSLYLYCAFDQKE